VSTESKASRISPKLKAVVAVLLVLLVTASSLLVYRSERNRGQTEVTIGDSKSINRVDILVFVQKVDPVTQTVTAQVQVTPQGSLADESGMPTQDLTVYTDGIKGDTLSFKAGKVPSIADLQEALNSGVITDYPFDHYKTDFSFDVETEDGQVPASVTFTSVDSLFTFAAFKADKNSDATVSFSVDVNRSIGTFAFALFVMLFMWCLSLAAVIAAIYSIGGRRGLLWPAQSFMGTLLFALVPLRNAVPGQPPVGSVIDFGSFFIAEGLISISLITTVVSGFLTERANEKLAREAKEQEAMAGPEVVPTAHATRVGGDARQ
jgi:Domain of unknown function (DUF4436)